MSNARTAHSSELLRGKLAAVRTKQLTVALGTGISWLALAAMGLLAAGMLVDWKFDIAREVRGLFLALDSAVLLVIFIRHIYTPLTTQPSDEVVALKVERATPEFRSRLIASTQFGAVGEVGNTEDVFVRALVKQTEEMARPKDFNSVVPAGGFARAFALSLLVVGLGFLSYDRYQPDSGALLKRAFLAPNVDVPRFTHIDKIIVKPSDVIARGDDLTIEVTLKDTSRVRPEMAVIAIKYASADRPTPHTCNNVACIFQLKLENVRESFVVNVTANDARKTRKVEVVPRPAVREIKFVQKFPSYTGLSEEPRRRGDLILLMGSSLKLEVTANKSVASGHVNIIRAEGEAESVPVEVSRSNPAQVSATLELHDLDIRGFIVRLIDKHGFESRNEAMYRITMLRDKPPIVRVLEPLRKETKVTQRARLPITVSVKDDYGVKQLRLMVKHGNAPPQPLVLGTDQAIGRLKRVEHEWKIVDLKPPVGSEITFWIEASDGCEPEQGIGKSRELIALVVTDDEKRRDLQNRATDSITGVNETAINQEKLNRELGEIIRARVITSPKRDE